MQNSLIHENDSPKDRHASNHHRGEAFGTVGRGRSRGELVDATESVRTANDRGSVANNELEPSVGSGIGKSEEGIIVYGGLGGSSPNIIAFISLAIETGRFIASPELLGRYGGMTAGGGNAKGGAAAC